jgi:hypothetical protein
MDKEKDIFIEVIKVKLTNYALPVDADSWDKLAEKLIPVPGKKAQWEWITALAVAASIALLFLLFPNQKKANQHETTNQPVVKDELPKLLAENNVNAINYPEKHRVVREKHREERPLSEIIPEEKRIEEPPTVVPTTEDNPPVIEENHSTPSVNNSDNEEEQQPPVIKHKKQQSIRFSIGSGGSLPVKNDMLESQNSGSSYANNIATSNTPKVEDILPNTDYTNVTYHAPLSFGVTVKKELDRTFAIESGIVYTFMSNSYSRASSPKSTAELQMHYIGIPLNLHAHILGSRFSSWEIYLSAGGMVEKGLFSHFVQKNYYNNSVYTATLNERINGLQCSVSIAPGVDYRIYKNYSIYIEPKLNYYFNNGQPVSTRTEHPVVLGINAGVRYSW